MPTTTRFDLGRHLEIRLWTEICFFATSNMFPLAFFSRFIISLYGGLVFPGHNGANCVIMGCKESNDLGESKENVMTRLQAIFQGTDLQLSIIQMRQTKLSIFQLTQKLGSTFFPKTKGRPSLPKHRLQSSTKRRMK